MSVKLGSFVKTITIHCPVSGVDVNVHSVILTGDLMTNDEIVPLTQLELLCKSIISWNLVDDNDQPLPITTENIKLLPADDTNYLVNQLNSAHSLSSEVKKNTRNNSIQPSTEAEASL